MSASPALHPPIGPDTTDAELAARAAAGETAAFERIMRRHNRLLFRTARSLLKSDAEAEDALQDAYLKAWRALGTFRADAKLSTWLVRIVANEALARLRPRSAQVISLDATREAAMDHHGERPAPEDALPDEPDARPDRIAMRGELRRLMEVHIDRLPEAFRTVFMLRAVEEWTIDEIAAALAIPEATVRTRFFRARGLLREALSQDIDVAMSDAFSFDGARCDRIVHEVLAALPGASAATAPPGASTATAPPGASTATAPPGASTATAPPGALTTTAPHGGAP